MERAAWTNERLDDLALAMREGFARVDQDFRDLREETGELRTELKAEIAELRQMMLRVGGGMLATMCVGFLSVLVAILARG